MFIQRTEGDQPRKLEEDKDREAMDIILALYHNLIVSILNLVIFSRLITLKRKLRLAQDLLIYIADGIYPHFDSTVPCAKSPD
ncbi:hypothetical protein BDZ94DRAFT_1252784 [Collybia nuda]|uniref:Uncharacterized protein n=1 Tax=Collybia nuda TaxID=64659 RepID=A0A9P5Y9D7_9AGAR|nr:hypothetical protein BDZ94DRAFT_1252784 [Collybia nuda]